MTCDAFYMVDEDDMLSIDLTKYRNSHTSNLGIR